jgi:O-antigen ligase
MMTTWRQWSIPALWLPGLILFGVNLTTTHAFYHVNSFKILCLAVGVTLLVLRHLPVFPKADDDRLVGKVWLWLMFPLLATIPGLFVHRLAFNYNFRYELVTNLLLILWAVYLVRRTKTASDLGGLYVFIGLIMIYIAGWSILEKTGLHPLYPDTPPVDMVKATFGHRNYLSGFLILLLPLLLMNAIPRYPFGDSSQRLHRFGFSRIHLFYLVAFACGILSLLLAQTRAAIAAGAVSLSLAVYLYAVFFTPPIWRRRLIRLLIVGLLLIIVSGGFLYFMAEQLASSRFAQLFTLSAWLGRLVPWQAAIASIHSSPLFGYGLGSSYNLFFSFVDPDARLFHHEHSYNHAHSEILEYLQESGALGLVVYLLFWGYVFYRLGYVLRRPRTDDRLVKAAIGVGCGLIAYHIHGSFSVAPRMLVMKLPLFTLLGLVFIFDKLDGDPEPMPSVRRWKKLTFGLSAPLVLITVWFLYLPWAMTQYRFAQIQQERPSQLQVEKLERLVRLSPDIYALDFLSRRQIEYRRADQLGWTLERIEQIIPHYRETGHARAIGYLMQNDLPNAKRAALAFQERDRYYLPTIELLLSLAAATDDPSLFREQFERFLRKLLVDHELGNREIEYQQRFRYFLMNDVLGMKDPGEKPRDSVSIEFAPLSAPLMIHTRDQQLIFRWSNQLLDQFFQAARAGRGTQLIPQPEKQRYRSHLFGVLNAQPYFQLTVNEAYQDQEPTYIRDLVQRYFQAQQNLRMTRNQLEQDLRNQRRQTATSVERRSAENRYRKALQQVDSEYRAQIAPIEAELRLQTDWDVYLTKQQFIHQFVNRFTAIIFPGFSS